MFNGACRSSLNLKCHPKTFSSRVCFITTIITNHGSRCVAECHLLCRVHLADNSRNDESSGVYFIGSCRMLNIWVRIIPTETWFMLRSHARMTTTKDASLRDMTILSPAKYVS